MPWFHGNRNQEQKRHKFPLNAVTERIICSSVFGDPLFYTTHRRFDCAPPAPPFFFHFVHNHITFAYYYYCPKSLAAFAARTARNSLFSLSKWQLCSLYTLLCCCSSFPAKDPLPPPLCSLRISWTPTRHLWEGNHLYLNLLSPTSSFATRRLLYVIDIHPRLHPPPFRSYIHYIHILYIYSTTSP